ncbi:MAG TPA: DNA polymerase IV [bacterium]
MLRWIAHLDMDCFFVSVERLLDPSLAGRPVVVGGDPGGRGVVASASYEARRFGVRSAMASRHAKQLCPHLIFVPGHHRLYGEHHRKVRTILERWAPVVEAASIDEFYLDFTGCNLIYDGGVFPLLRRIRARIADELGLPSSAGLAGNRLVAKIGSRLAKPAGVAWIPHGAEADILAPLPVRALPGVGPVTAAALQRLGVTSIGQLASMPANALAAALGSWGPDLARRARGESDSPVGEGGERKSVGHETTFDEDTADPVLLEATLCRLVGKAAHRLRRTGMKAGGITVKVRYADFRTVTRSRALPAGSDRDGDLLAAARELLLGAAGARVRVRLIGISLERLRSSGEQLGLFGAARDARRAALYPAVDRLREKYGFGALELATSSLHGRGNGGII